MEVETRMASIVIPNVNEDGDIFVPVQQQVIELFMDEFGGATMYECHGFWSKSSKIISCAKIDVAVDMLPETVGRFMEIVKMVADECKVHSIMATKPDGTVTFVEGDLYDGTKKV